MSSVKITGTAVPNMPWQERPAGSREWMPLWRYSENPIIGRNPAEGVARIFNSAVIPYEGAFIGVFRGNRPTESRISILEEARTAFTGTLTGRRSLFRTKRAMILCRRTRMIRGW